MRNLGLGAILMVAASAFAQPVADAEQKTRLLEQKLKLVEMLVNSPAAQATSVGKEAETPALIQRSQSLIKEARLALAGQRFDEATQALDEALRNVSKASNRMAGEGGMADSAQKKQFSDYQEQLAAYRLSVQDMAKDPRISSAARQLLGRLDGLTEDGQKLANAGRIGDANKKMGEAYKLAVEEISKLRAGHEVVMSLKFDSPLEEYVYEQKRYQSSEIMVSMMVSEGKAEGGRRKLVDGFLGEALRLKDEASKLANLNDHKAAVSSMEKAVTQLNRALQAMGVPVF